MRKCTKAQFGESTKEQLEDRPFTSYKRSTDLKQNCTQEKAPFSSTVFHTLSHGVICFVASVGSKNHLLAEQNSLLTNQKLLFNGSRR